MIEIIKNEMTYRTKQEILDAAGYKSKTGRPNKIDKPSSVRNIHIPDRIWDKLPEPKSDSVRNGLDFCITNGVL